MTDPTTGKLQWTPIVAFETKQIGDRFSAQVIEALRGVFPTALPDPAAQGDCAPYIPPGAQPPTAPTVEALARKTAPPQPGPIDLDDDEELDVLNAALALAATGTAGVPVQRRKRPAIPKAKGGNGFHDASTDPDRIREMWDLAGAAAQTDRRTNRRRQRLRRAGFRSAPRFG